MIIDEQMLETFNACAGAKNKFLAHYPDGYDISGLWTVDRDKIWQEILASDLKRYVGWAIGVGILPSRIVAALRGADLRRANLRRADLRRADLYRADLQEANLQGANLQEANLQEANLQEANLHRANLYRADLQGADLQGANYDRFTFFPDGFEVESKDMVFHKF